MLCRGSAIDVLIAQRIERGMISAFPHPSVFRDAYQILVLSDKGGKTIHSVLMETVFGTTLTCAFVFGDFPPLVVLRFGLAFLSGYATYSLVRSHIMDSQMAQREMDDLIRSNEAYWKPIVERVHLVVSEAGKLDGYFWPVHIAKFLRMRK